MHRPKEKEEVLEGKKDDEFLVMEHNLRREELERDDF